eukprot:34779-Eustigmatos_ZCMA.PRE.1
MTAATLIMMVSMAHDDGVADHHVHNSMKELLRCLLMGCRAFVHPLSSSAHPECGPLPRLSAGISAAKVCRRSLGRASEEWVARTDRT